jgi:hypothetical protein
MRRFGEFVNSPYFNKRQQITDFVQYLLCFYPDFDKNGLSIVNIPYTILPLGKRTKKELSYIKSEVYKLAKQYVGFESARQEPYLFDYYIALGLLEKDNTSSVKQLKKLKQEIEYCEKPRFQEMYMQFSIIELLRAQLSKNVATSETLLQDSIDSLERFYMYNKVGHSWEIYDRGATVRIKDGFRNPLIDSIEEYLSTKPQVDPQVAVFFQLYLTTKYPEKAAHFDELLRLLHLYHNNINEEDLRSIYLATINTSIRYMRIDIKKYTVVTLNLYVEGIKSKALFEKGILSPWTYSNAIKLGIRLRRFEWVRGFIEEYNEFLAPDERLNAFHVNSAELAFAQMQYDLTFEHLKEINTKNFRYYLSTQVLYIKAFYETDNIDSCLYILAALKSYLSRRKEVSKAIKKNYLHFGNLLLRILLLGSSEKRKNKLNEDLNSKQMLEKEWLLSVFNRESKRMYT